MFKNFLNKAMKLLITWDALWSVPVVGFLLFYATGKIHEIAPETDLWGLNQMQDIMVSAFKMMVGNFVAQVGLAINVFLFFGYKLSSFKKDFNNLQTCQKVFAVVACYLCYLLVFAALQPR
jgi:hypothetical protein